MTIMNIITQKARKTTQPLFMMQSLLESLVYKFIYGFSVSIISFYRVVFYESSMSHVIVRNITSYTL